MPCKAGYPGTPCPFGFEGRVTREACGSCKNFVPPKYILTSCMLYDRESRVCQLPKSSCASCPEFLKRGPGRPRGELVDWNDPESRRKYFSEYRKNNPEVIQGAQERFKSANPTYQQDYYQANRERLLAKAKARYQEKQRARAANTPPEGTKQPGAIRPVADGATGMVDGMCGTGNGDCRRSQT